MNEPMEDGIHFTRTRAVVIVQDGVPQAMMSENYFRRMQELRRGQLRKTEAKFPEVYGNKEKEDSE